MKYLQASTMLGLMLLGGCADHSMQCDPIKTNIIGLTNEVATNFDSAHLRIDATGQVSLVPPLVERVCGPPSYIRYSMNMLRVLHEQWVYDRHGSGRSGYIYLDDKVVTGWQVP